MDRHILPFAAILSAGAAAVLWCLLLTGGSRNDIRVRDETMAATGGDPMIGLTLIQQSGCAACHEISGVCGPDGKTGPSLKGVGSRQTIAGRLANTPQNMTLWIEHPHAVDADTAMPELGLSHQQAQHIAAYLYTTQK